MANEPYPTPGKPYAIEAHFSDSFKRRWKLVRRDSFTDIPGRIVSADELTGAFEVEVPDGSGGTKKEKGNLGVLGHKIVGRSR